MVKTQVVKTANAKTEHNPKAPKPQSIPGPNQEPKATAVTTTTSTTSAPIRGSMIPRDWKHLQPKQSSSSSSSNSTCSTVSSSNTAATKTTDCSRNNKRPRVQEEMTSSVVLTLCQEEHGTSNSDSINHQEPVLELSPTGIGATTFSYKSKQDGVPVPVDAKTKFLVNGCPLSFDVPVIGKGMITWKSTHVGIVAEVDSRSRLLHLVLLTSLLR